MKPLGFSLFDLLFVAVLLVCILALLAWKSCADSALWNGGIADVPTAQGSGLATVAYDGETAFFWLQGDVQGAQGYLASGPFIAGLLSYNTGQVSPDYIRFWGSAPVQPGTDYRLLTAMEKVAPGALVPVSIFESAPFSIQGGRIAATSVPEPGIVALLLFGLFATLKPSSKIP